MPPTQTLIPGYAYLDESRKYACLYNPRLKWNGWDVPYFTFPVAKTMAENMPYLEYEPESKLFLDLEMAEIYPAVQGPSGQDLFCIGGYFWTWLVDPLYPQERILDTLVKGWATPLGKRESFPCAFKPGEPGIPYFKKEIIQAIDQDRHRAPTPLPLPVFMSNTQYPIAEHSWYRYLHSIEWRCVRDLEWSLEEQLTYLDNPNRCPKCQSAYLEVESTPNPLGLEVHLMQVKCTACLFTLTLGYELSSATKE